MNLYTASNLTRSYNGRAVFHLPSMSIQRTSTLAIVGPNGSGKSTLLRVLAFLEVPNTGALTFHGTPGQPPRLEATLLLQEPYLLKRTVFENIAYGLRVRGQCQNIEVRVREALEAVGFVPRTVIYRQWRELSGGECQRVALAARLIVRPLALLLDEPTSNLDTRSAVAIQEAVREAVAQGTTVVVASHDRPWLDTLCADTLRLGIQ